ncbi:hypothetical protein D3C85_1376210 [compost metagenome]
MDRALVFLLPVEQGLRQQLRHDVVLLVAVAIGVQPQFASAVLAQQRGLVADGDRGADIHPVGQCQRVLAAQAHAAVAAKAGHAGGLVGAVKAEAKLGFAKADEHRPQRIVRPGGDGGLYRLRCHGMAGDGGGQGAGRKQGRKFHSLAIQDKRILRC